MTPRILLRHLTGSKAYRVDQFPLVGLVELTLGRATTSDVRFDGPLEDTISRRHAMIRVSQGDPLSVRIVDLDSGNGVRVNGRPVQVEQDLRTDDLVELGPNGPAFRLDVEPASALSRNGRDATIRMPFAMPPQERGDAPLPVRACTAAGRPTRSTLALAAAVALAAGAGVILGRHAVDGVRVRLGGRIGQDRPEGREPAAPPAPAPPVAAAVPAAVPPRPVDAPAPSAAVVAIEARWRLYDKATGQPVFQKVLVRRGQRLACLIDVGDGRIVPWLTTADEDHLNTPVGGVIQGSGFIVGSDGSIITDRHIAAGWTARHLAAGASDRQVALFRAGDGHAASIVSPGDLRNGSGPAAWVPGDAGMLFGARRPVAIGTAAHNFEGRNDRLDVLLPRSHAHTPARLVLLSSKADVAELRIDVGRPLPVLALARDPVAATGTPVTILGYLGAPPRALDAQHREGRPEDGLPLLVSATGTMAPAHDPAAGPSPANPLSTAELFRLSTAAAAVPDGGAVLGADGAVLGVVTSDPAAQERPLLAFAAAAARALLDSR